MSSNRNNDIENPSEATKRLINFMDGNKWNNVLIQHTDGRFYTQEGIDRMNFLKNNPAALVKSNEEIEYISYVIGSPQGSLQASPIYRHLKILEIEDMGREANQFLYKFFPKDSIPSATKFFTDEIKDLQTMRSYMDLLNHYESYGYDEDSIQKLQKKPVR